MEKEQIGNDNVMVIDLVQLMQALWHRVPSDIGIRAFLRLL